MHFKDVLFNVGRRDSQGFLQGFQGPSKKGEIYSNYN